MNLKTTLGLSLLFATATLLAQNASLSGSIKTAEGAPAEFVNVGLKGISKGATADKNGNYLIKNINPGTYTVMATFVGMGTKEQVVELASGNNKTLDFVLEENAQQLEEIIVSSGINKYNATTPSSSLRLNAPLIEVPQNIQMVTKDMLKDQQVISMSDGLIRNVSGAVRNEHWGDLYANLSYRGSQIQAFRNGFNVVSSFWGPLTEDMSFVDHIEFVKGPAGFMLANGDPSGLYNVVTKKPTGQSKVEVSFTLGSFNLYRSALDLDGKLSQNGKLLYRLNLAAQNKKSHRANEFNNRYTIAPVISYQLDDKTKLTLEYNYQRANMSDVGSFYVYSGKGFATLPRDFTTLSPGMPATNINDHSAYLNLEHKFNNSWKITGQLSRFYYYQMGTSMWPNSVDSSGKMIRSIGSWEAKSTMALGQVFLNGEVMTGAVRHRILAGLDVANKEYFADWGQSHALDSVGAEFNVNDPYYGTPVNGYPHFNYSTPLEQRAQEIGGTLSQQYASAYVQDELGFFENKLRLSLAGRYTNVSQAEWGGKPKKAEKFSPRAGLSGSLNKSTALYALYDQAFVPQSGKLANGNSVKPITGSNIEVGIKKDWMDGKWNTSLSVYQIVKNNELTADPNSPPAAGLSIVMGQKVSKGFELDIKGRIAKGLNVTANYAYTDSRITKLAEGITDQKVGDVVPGYAQHVANAWINYQLQNGSLKGFGLSAGGTFMSGRNTYSDKSPNSKEVLPDYIKIDGGLFYEKDNFKITGNVFNILDEYLYSGSYYKWLNAYYWQTEPGRNFRLSVTYKF